MNSKIINTFKSYIRAGKLPLMLGLAPFFIGKNKKKLEIFRERVNQGIHETLVRQYYKKKINTNYNSNKKNKAVNNPIWFMWLQGIDKAPRLCQLNYKYLVHTFGARVKLITEKNVLDYVDFPEFLIRKRSNGEITNAHYSDIVRIQLLCTYGGTWIDSTLVVKKKFIQDLPEIEIPQTFKPGSDGQVIPVSNWFIHAEGENEFLKRVRDLLFEYWKKNTRAIDYFIFHHFMIMASEEMGNYLDNVFPLDNTIPHYLMIKMRKTNLTTLQIKNLFDQFSIMKFTNKHENSTETDNYAKLLRVFSYYDKIENGG